jgi:hypothetical protein
VKSAVRRWSSFFVTEVAADPNRSRAGFLFGCAIRGFIYFALAAAITGAALALGGLVRH